MLWSFSPQDFVAHCFADADEDQIAATPVVLASELRQVPHHEVLLNLDSQVPAGFERFLRLIEVVSSVDEQDRGMLDCVGSNTPLAAMPSPGMTWC